MKKFTYLSLLIIFLSKIVLSQTSYLEIKVYLEGPYFNGMMTPFLNVLGELPIQQPYNTFPWNYNGNESVSNIPNYDVVDWILIDILKVVENEDELLYEILGQETCFILKDGQVTSLDGSSYISFANINLINCYIRIHHRNHLPIISSTTLTENEGIYSYDFSTGPDKVMGDKYTLKQLSSNIWGMIAADGNANG